MLQYGKGAIAGHPSTDRACFSGDSKHCVDKLSFLTVVKGKDLESLKGSGLIGLAPTPVKNAKEFDDPLHNGVPGFVAQLKHSAKYNADFDPVFSFYLSNKTSENGKMLFGGADYNQYAKKGLGEKDVFWAKQSSNDSYWAVNNSDIKFGDKALVSKK